MDTDDVIIIQSPVKAISCLRIKQTVDDEVINVTKAVQTRSCIVLLGDDGVVYAPFLEEGTYGCYIFTWTTYFLQSLVLLGLLTQKDVDKHLRECMRRENKRNKQSNAEDVISSAQKVGMKLTDAQKKYLKKCMR